MQMIVHVLEWGAQCAEITKFFKEFCSKTVWMDRAFTIWVAKANNQSADQFSSMKSNAERWFVLVLVKVAADCVETVVFEAPFSSFIV
jgi:hypothetical protein